MRDHDRLDLAELGTERDPARWKAVVDARLARVDEALAARAPDPLSLIASWSRPLLIGTGVAVALLLPAELLLELREARAERVQRLVALSADWDGHEPPPSGEDFLRALARGDAR